MTSMPPADPNANQSAMAPIAVSAEASAAASMPMAVVQPRVNGPGNGESYSAPDWLGTNATAANAAPPAAGAPIPIPIPMPSLNDQPAQAVGASSAPNPPGSSGAPQPQDPLPCREQQQLNVSQPGNDQGVAGEMNASLQAPVLLEGSVGQPIDYSVADAQVRYF